MRVLRANDYRRMPWKNGGGVTTEIAVFPEGAGLDDFEWRLSMANVASDGPFSAFAGIERTLVVLEGEGIVLSVGGSPDVTLTRASEPFSFRADETTSARLIAGPILDFNVTTRRGRTRHNVERLAHKASAPRPGGLVAILCASGTAKVSSAGEQATLRPHDAAIIEAAPFTIDESNHADLLLVTLERAQS